jgi:hypothetical protein
MTQTSTDGPVEALDRSLTDRLEILEVTSRMGLLVDAREWDSLEALFTDPVCVDYTSLNGGEPQSLAAGDLVAGWRGVLERLQATEHLIGGQVIELDGDTARCAANVQGTHVLPNRSGGPLWTVGGRYDFELIRTPDGWRISALTLTVRWATGNQQIMRAAGSPAPRGTDAR